jgi:hypothetical protein
MIARSNGTKEHRIHKQLRRKRRNQVRKIKAITFAALIAMVAGFSVINAVPVTPPGPNATLGCRDGQSDVTLQASISNNGPDVIPAGTTIYVSYKRFGDSESRLSRVTAVNAIEAGKSSRLELSPATNWYPQIEQCTATLTAPKIKPPVKIVN